MNEKLIVAIARIARAVVIGGGPAGLMAADRLAASGLAVTLCEQMPTPGRKFLMAGRGGLNLTHVEAFEPFMARYRASGPFLRPSIENFTPEDLRAWSAGLGQPTFVGSSGRVFPKSFKASPLLRAWLLRLASLDVEILTRRRWCGLDSGGAALIAGPDGAITALAHDVLVLALGGASWPRLGSDGDWVALLRNAGASVAPLRPANCGFEIGWSEHFKAHSAGQPLKRILARFEGEAARGEAMLTTDGVEGGIIYALSARLRDAIERQGHATLDLDLRPDLPLATIAARLSQPRAGQSSSNILRKAAGLSPGAIAVMREVFGQKLPDRGELLAQMIKNVSLRLTAARPVGRAISSAGGVTLDALDDNFMLLAKPGVFVAGEMIDWEAPTGGYLMQACLATGAGAARGAVTWLKTRQKTR